LKQSPPTGEHPFLDGKKAIPALAPATVFSERTWESLDSVKLYLPHVLGFIGIDYVQSVRAGSMNIPPLAIPAVRISQLFANSIHDIPGWAF
jgi:FMN-dependent NADH-azoreductase